MERLESSWQASPSSSTPSLPGSSTHWPQQGRASPPHTFPSWAGGGAPLLPARGQDNSRVTSNHKAWEQPDWTTDDKFRSNRSLARNSVLTQTLALLLPSQRNRLPSSDLSASQAPGPSPAAPGRACTFPKTTSERYQGHSDSAPSRVATGVHNHLQHSLHVYVYHQRCEDDWFQFSYVLSQAAR